jgi:putative cell wall-binding protein/6-phosphogluconolactonase (cycloisomerase 2 family)
MATRLGARAVAVALVGASLLLVGSGAPVAADDATTCPAPGGGWSRLSGTDRYSTAVTLGDAKPGGTAYVASGDAFADALAAGPAVGDGVLLLVRRDAVPEATRAELGVLQPSRIVVVGGTSVIGASVEATLRTLTHGTVTRVAGSDRYATAAALVAAGFPDRASTVRLVAGATFADALAAGAAGAPLLLTGRDSLPSSTAAQLSRLAPTTVEIVGGTATVSKAVMAAVHDLLPGAVVRRIAGVDRYQTAAALAAAAGTAGTATVLAAGGDFPDALAAIPAAIRRQAPLLLVPPDGSIPSQVAAVVDGRPASELLVVGGTTSVADDVIARLRPAAIACLLINPGDLRADTPIPATVRLRAPAPPGGALIALAADNAGVTMPATLAIAPGATTGTFSFTATRAALTAGTSIRAEIGASSRSVPVRIASTLPTITSFTSSASILTTGQVVRLTWTTTDAVSCSIDNGVGAVPCNGATTLIPGATKTYTLQASSTDLTVSTSATFTVGQRSRFLYVTHSSPRNEVSALSIDDATGQLTAIGAPLATGGATAPLGVDVDPTGRYAYVALSGTDQIAMYRIDATTGALTANGTIAGGNAARQPVVDPSGRYVFLINQNGSGTVSPYRIGATGQLTSNGATLAAGQQPTEIAIDPTGRYLYVLAFNAKQVSEFSIGDTGQLTSIGSISTGASSNPHGLVVEPGGKYVYVGNINAPVEILRFSIGTTGTLTALGTTVTAGGAAPVALAVHPNGKNLYATFSNVDGVGTWAIGADGDLTFVNTLTMAGARPGWIAIDSAGRYAYLPLGTTLYQNSIDAATGAMTQLAPPSVTIDNNGFRAAGSR